eukprot:scaffold19600_cov109-Phaeocystis_antarctica.AAC.1
MQRCGRRQRSWTSGSDLRRRDLIGALQRAGQSAPRPHCGRRAAQKRVTGGRWRRIVLGHVLAEHVVRVEEVVRVSGRRSSGRFGSGRTAGYAIGEGRTSPWLEAIAGIRERPYPRPGLQARAGSTDPIRGTRQGDPQREGKLRMRRKRATDSSDRVVATRLVW